ncbi:tRNA (adenosine(37)-N6)-threonylcarbamoyltransferase complex ATPase subunit type 1 TsaE [Candidatus Marinamargulisbacteria bacterium SCGC AAA071-K20]|nr:tRNA (adenosine(37)-N6)-threonylcarbamoyltransferase complex ATPase subunit type 1 TsaE [Candidatus Marinamargulisbacteria bacterium SCGC AAA071-K20]
MVSLRIIESELDSFTKKISEFIKPGDTLLLYGDMGAGKTTFTRSLASHYGINTVSSPTFSLVNRYEGDTPIDHIDLYRLNSEKDFYSFDLDKYLTNEESVTIIEWSEKIGSFLPESYWKIEFKYCDESTRDVNITILHDDSLESQLKTKLRDFNISS